MDGDSENCCRLHGLRHEQREAQHGGGGGGDDGAIPHANLKWANKTMNIFVGVRYFSYCVGVIQSGGDLILFDNVMLWPSPGFTKISVEQCGASEHTASLTRHSLRGQKT